MSGEVVAVGHRHGASVYSVWHGLVVGHSPTETGRIFGPSSMVQYVFGSRDGSFVVAYPWGLFECFDYDSMDGCYVRWSYSAEDTAVRKRIFCVSSDGRWLFIVAATGFQCLDCDTGNIVGAGYWDSQSVKIIGHSVYAAVPSWISEVSV